MSPMHVLVLALSFPFAAAHAAASESLRYLELSNRAHDSLVALAVAAPGSQAFHDVPLGPPLQGGGNSATVGVAGPACRYDLRLTFKDGRAVLYPDVDVCGTRLSVHPLPKSRQRMPGVAAASRTSP